MAFLFVSSSGLYMPSYVCMPLSKRQGKAFYQKSPNIHRFSTLLHDTPNRVVSIPKRDYHYPTYASLRTFSSMPSSTSYHLRDMWEICLPLLGSVFLSAWRGERFRGLYLSFTKTKRVSREGLVVFFSLFLFLSSSSIPELDGVNHASRLIPFGVRR